MLRLSGKEVTLVRNLSEPNTTIHCGRRGGHRRSQLYMSIFFSFFCLHAPVLIPSTHCTTNFAAWFLLGVNRSRQLDMGTSWYSWWKLIDFGVLRWKEGSHSCTLSCPDCWLLKRPYFHLRTPKSINYHQEYQLVPMSNWRTQIHPLINHAANFVVQAASECLHAWCRVRRCQIGDWRWLVESNQRNIAIHHCNTIYEDNNAATFLFQLDILCFSSYVLSTAYFVLHIILDTSLVSFLIKFKYWWELVNNTSYRSLFRSRENFFTLAVDNNTALPQFRYYSKYLRTLIESHRVVNLCD